MRGGPPGVDPPSFIIRNRLPSGPMSHGELYLLWKILSGFFTYASMPMLIANLKDMERATAAPREQGEERGSRSRRR